MRARICRVPKPYWVFADHGGLIPLIACALGAVFGAAGSRVMTPMTAAAMLSMLAAIYLTFRRSVEKVS